MLPSDYLVYDESSPSCVRWIRDSEPNKYNRNPHFKGDVFGTVSGKGYFRASFNSKSWYVHRMVWLLHYGQIDDDLQIDHIDGNKQNNKLSNLRLVTACENQQNLRTVNSSSGHKGIAISEDRKTICYYGTANGKRYWSKRFKISDFDSLEHAIDKMVELRNEATKEQCNYAKN